MEEESEGVQGTSLLTLFKAVCKKWLLIGFLTVFGALLGCVYAFAALPLTKDVFKVSFDLNPSNSGVDKTVSYYNDSVIANIKSYFSDTDYKYNVFSGIKDDIFKDIEDAEKKEAEFKKTVSVTVSVSTTVYVMNQEKGAAETILNAFVEEAKRFVGNMMNDMNTTGADKSEIVGVVVVSREIIKADPKDANIQGYIGARDRIVAVIIGVLLGLVAGAAAAVCIYYFNNRLNSVQMLNSMGFTQVYVDKKHKNNGASVYDENAVRYNFVIEKKGCKVITFISPEKTEASAAAVSAQAESLRRYGYRVAEIAQGGQTCEEWKEALKTAAAGNDFVLVDARKADNFDCAVPGALSDGVAVIVDQKHAKTKQLKHIKEIIETAKLKTLATVVVNTREDFIHG